MWSNEEVSENGWDTDSSNQIIKWENLNWDDKLNYNYELLKQKKVICFDLYWTLISKYSYKKLIESLENLNLWLDCIPAIKEYFEIIQTNRKADINIDSLEISKIPGAIDAISDYFREQISNTYIYWDVIDSLLKLKEKWYKLALISNLSEEFMAPLEEKIPNYKEIFDYRAFSFDVKKRKPKIEIFKKIIEDSNNTVTFSDMVMIWDTPKEDIKWAKDAWMYPILLDRKSEKMYYDEKKDLIVIHKLNDLLNIFK